MSVTGINVLCALPRRREFSCSVLEVVEGSPGCEGGELFVDREDAARHVIVER